jgi:hypothetical protein
LESQPSALVLALSTSVRIAEGAALADAEPSGAVIVAKRKQRTSCEMSASWLSPHNRERDFADPALVLPKGQRNIKGAHFCVGCTCWHRQPGGEPC